jgi:diguanylate cyclase (GGDEF)-like protein
MRGIKGDALLIQLHTLYPKTLKIMLTGQADADSVGNVVNAAALYRYIRKPWEAADLILKVTEALGCFQQEQQLADQNKSLKEINAELENSLSLMKHQALHDALTNLPNRVLFDQKFAAALNDAANDGKLAAVMFLDLDRFNEVNDTLGHAVGDLLLQNVVQCLVGCLRETDVIARWGGDEFVILLPQIRCREDASEIAHRFIEVLQSDFFLEGYCLNVTTSIGIAVYPHDGLDSSTLLQNADAALYQVKKYGRNHYQHYSVEVTASH